MRLFSKIIPDLKAGSYKARLMQRIDKGATLIGEADDVDVHFDVTAPRYRLPGPEIHSVFPPANAQGSFSSRLAHVALKRRTLPWERHPGDGAPAETPWMALVVLADYEAEFCPNEKIRDAFTTSGAADAADAPATGTCDHIKVTRRVVEKVFPSVEEIPLLTHVRQVSLQDAENLGSDPDGWMAVLMSNRLPQPKTTYRAYVVSLEGQIGLLPQQPIAVQQNIGGVLVYEEMAIAVAAVRASRHPAPGLAFEATSEAAAELDPLLLARAEQIVAIEDATGVKKPRAAQAAGWSDAVVDSSAVSASATEVQSGQTEYIGVNHLIPAVLLDPLDMVYRFPVLAHWTFTTEGLADFQALMEGLHCVDESDDRCRTHPARVGMLGTMRAGTENPPEVVETGHTRIERLSRRGEESRAWYRGPFTPHEVERRSDPPFFHSDQAVRIDEQADIDLSEAAGFEIGRLLALSDAAFLEELARWRRQGFRIARNAIVGKLDAVIGSMIENDVAATGRLLKLHMLHEVATSDFGPGPVVDPVDYMDDLDAKQDIKSLAVGLGIADDELVGQAISPGIATKGVAAELAESSLPQSFGAIIESGTEDLAGLAGQLSAAVDKYRLGSNPGANRPPGVGDAERGES